MSRITMRQLDWRYPTRAPFELAGFCWKDGRGEFESRIEPYLWPLDQQLSEFLGMIVNIWLMCLSSRAALSAFWLRATTSAIGWHRSSQIPKVSTGLLFSWGPAK
jgi:hypothetical protein